jgi:hypothetical protein
VCGSTCMRRARLRGETLRRASERAGSLTAFGKEKHSMKCVCVRRLVSTSYDHIQAAPLHHIKRETPAETAIQPRERHKQRRCVCAWHSLKGERLIGFLQTWQQKCHATTTSSLRPHSSRHAIKKGLRRQYLNVPSALFFSNMT